jgi:predicted ATPase
VKKPNVVLNSGAGGVGKTSVVTKVMEFAPSFNKRVVTMPSPTRSVYARLGISTEKKATEMTLQEQFDLQDAIHEAYYSHAESFILGNQDADLIMIDRSPLDHVSYLLHNLAREMTMTQVNERVSQAYSWMFEQSLNARTLQILCYPFPQSWHVETDNDSSDGFRFDKGGKNFLWACVLDSLLDKVNKESMKSRRYTGMQGGYSVCAFPDDNMSINDRASFVLSQLT